MGILTEMSEIHCDAKNIDFKSLFSHIEIFDDENKRTKQIEQIINILDAEGGK